MWKGMKEWPMGMKLEMTLEWASVMLGVQKMLWTCYLCCSYL